ncbi:NUDIX domain-containing protein [Phaeacidiphilus oryzae]|uniref:NUDIX domain-containing protein n=1 Tax=Phaeacidiphilus oryzae TaxID=348818 RepID=UPI00068B6881|nr:NUDIX hydrolase [Phaeacidiphilus oryzae]
MSSSEQSGGGRVGVRIADEPAEWTTRSSVTPFTGAVTGVRTDEVVMPDGSVARRDYQVHPGSVAVLALDERPAEQGGPRVLVISQYRHPVRQRLWEIPAGLLDVPGEPPLEAAQRELYEEAHAKAGDWRVLVDLYNSPGGSDEALRVFLARDLAEAEGERFAAEGEELDLQVSWAPLNELVDGVLAGELHNVALVAAVLALRTALERAGGIDSLRPADAPWPARPFD